MDHRLPSLLAALALAVNDRQTHVTDTEFGRGSGTAALVHVTGHPGESVEALTRVLGLSHPGTVAVVERLVSSDLVERRPGADRRTHALHATPHGEEMLRRVLTRRGEVLDGVLAPLEVDQRQDLTALLEIVVGHLATNRADGRIACRLCNRNACYDGGCPLGHL